MDYPPFASHELQSRYTGLFPPYSEALQWHAQPPGFSGASVWKVRSRGDDWCLRGWPPAYSRARIDWIHTMLDRVHAAGITGLALPQVTTDGKTCWELRGRCFELTPWLPGAAADGIPSEEQWASSCQWLADFHEWSLREDSKVVLPPPSIERRWRYFQKLTAAHPRLQRCLDRVPNRLRAAATITLDAFTRQRSHLANQLEMALRGSGVTCLCLRDIWRAHVLFTGAKVTGVIDYDALDWDVPETDVARLMGSFAQGDSALWHRACRLYEQARQTPVQWNLIETIDLANGLMAGPQWLLWLFVERRTFADPIAAEKRLIEWADIVRRRGW